MNEEELLEVIKTSLEDHTIDEAIKIKDEEDKVVKESFDVTWENYNNVVAQRKEMLKSISIIRFRFVFLKALSMIVNYRALGELDYLEGIITNSRLEIQDQKRLLDAIRDAIKKLQEKDVIECNYNICDLLAAIYDKDQVLFNTLIREMEISTAAIKGINITYPDSPHESVDKLNKDIDDGIKKLGLVLS